EEDAEGLVPQLHAELVRSGAMPMRDASVFGPTWREITQGVATREQPWWHARRDALLELASAGTPRYVYDLATVRARAAALDNVGAVDRRYYAMKANPHPALLRSLAEAGFGFECVSAGELARVFEVLPRIAPEKVLFTPSFAPRAEYADALSRGVTVT